MLLARTLNNRDKLRSPGGRSGGTSASGLSSSRSTSLLRSGSTESESWGRGPVLPGLTRPVPHHLGVDGAADTVGELGVQLGQLVACVHAGIGDVPHGGGLNNVPDHELLDGLVQGLLKTSRLPRTSATTCPVSRESLSRPWTRLRMRLSVRRRSREILRSPRGRLRETSS